MCANVLLRAGLFTFVNMHFLMVLVKPCPSLPTMLKLSSVVGWPVVESRSCVGDGGFKYSLNLS